MQCVGVKQEYMTRIITTVLERVNKCLAVQCLTVTACYDFLKRQNTRTDNSQRATAISSFSATFAHTLSLIQTAFLSFTVYITKTKLSL
jgi:hypothetical protein